MRKLYFLLGIMILMSTMTFAGLTGTKNIPGDYANVGAAVADLNTNGVGVGGVTFLIADGITLAESPINITSSGSTANPIVFKQSGTGTKPILNFTGTAGTADAAFQLTSVSYISFIGLDIRDAGSAMEYGFFLKGSATVGSQNNNVTNCNVTLKQSNINSKGIYVLSIATAVSGANSGNKFYNNFIKYCNHGYYIQGIAGTTFYDDANEIGIINGGTSTVQNIGGNAANAYGIYAQYQKNVKVFNTTVSAVSTSGSSYLAKGINVTDNLVGVTIYNNTVFSISNVGGATGIYVYSGYNQNIYNNVVHTITSTSSSVVGIFHSSQTTYDNAYNNTVYDISTNAATGIVVPASIGIQSGNGNHNVYNNVIYDVRAPAFSSTAYLGGLGYYAAATQTCNFFDNTVYMNYTPTAANNQSACVYFISSCVSVNLKNNVLVNKCNFVSTGLRAVAFYKQNSDNTYYSIESNNNCFYAGTPSTKNLLYYDGTNSSQTLDALKAFSSPRESQSVTEDVPFVNVTTSPYDLHINSTTPSQCESAGVTISTTVVKITTDHDGTPRYPNTGFPTNLWYSAVAPDLGAYESGSLSADLTGPDIQYVPLTNTGSILPRVVTATITDVKSGVPVGGNDQLPRLYWNTSTNPTWLVSLGTSMGNGLYSFAFGGGNLNDIVHYYFAAQDNAATPNPTAKPLNSVAYCTANPPATNVPPSPTLSYTILPPISGTKTIGSTGCDFTTLTGEGGLFQAINNSIVAGDLTVYINTDLSEPGTYQLNNTFETDPGGYKINILPGDVTEKVITNSVDVPMIVFNGADRVTVDGFVPGKGRLLRFRNTSTTNSVIVFQNTSTNDTLRGCIIEGACSTGAIKLGNFSGTAENNAYIAITNNICQGLTNGTTGSPTYFVYTAGIAGSLISNILVSGNDFIDYKNTGVFIGAQGAGSGFTITNNNFYQVSGSAQGGMGIQILAGVNSGGHVVSGNYIGGSAPHCGGTPFIIPVSAANVYGIYMNVGTAVPSEIQGNVIKNFSITGVGASNFRGIFLTAGAANIGTTAGNLIGDTAVSNSVTISGTAVSYGIVVNGPSTVNNNVIAGIHMLNQAQLNSFQGIALQGNYNQVCERNKIINVGPGTGAYNTTTNKPVTGIYCQGIAGMNSTYTVDNNLISLGGDGVSHDVELDGITVFAATGDFHIYQNTVLITGTAASANTRSSAAFLKSDAGRTVCEDNIFSNFRVNGTGGTGKHYGINGQNTTTFTSDYNDVYSSASSTIARWGATDCDFATYKTLSGNEANSVSVDPSFISNSDLHPNNATLNSAGIAISGFTTDFANVTRSNPPDIGAYEFNLAGSKTINVKLFLEGYFNSESGTMNKVLNTDGDIVFDAFPGRVVDTLTVALAQITEPFNTVFTKYGAELQTDGTVSINDIPSSLSGSYYIIFRHRNHVETWSEAVNLSGITTTYDMTDAATKAWGSNLKPMGSFFTIFAGDANGDQYVDVVDVGMVFNKNLNGDFGYQAEDVNGDGFIDVLDVGLVFNNNLLGAGQNTPINPMGPIHTNKR